MKKFITLAMSLFIMTTMMGTSIHAENSDTLDDDKNSTEIGVSTAETITVETSTDEAVFKVKVDWSTVGAVYGRTDTYTWDTESLKYVIKEENRGEAVTTDATATITLTNYSNTEVDYDISFASETVGTGENKKNIASETKHPDSAAEASGTLDSADTEHEISDTQGTVKSKTYIGTISYLTANYLPTDNSNTSMGTYTVTISKPLTLSESTLTLRAGKTATITANKDTGVTWSTSDENVATVNASTGLVTAKAAGTATITATANGKTATCTVTVKPADFVYNTASDNNAFTTLLASDTVTFEYDSITYTAYNGFISETAYADWYEAQDFVKDLNGTGTNNTTKILPTDVSDPDSGTWILLETANMCYAWADVSGANNSHVFANYETVFEGVYCLWTSDSKGSDGYYFRGFQGDRGCGSKTNCTSGYGFVVIWAPSNSN